MMSVGWRRTAALVTAAVSVIAMATAAKDDSSRWVQLQTATDDTGHGLGPQETMAAAGGLVENSTMILFGGCTSSCCFAPIDSLWQLEVSGDHTRAKWTPLKPPSPRPTARFYTASASTAQGLVYFFGGQDSSMKFLDQLWVYAYADNRWRQVEVKGEKPSPRATATLSVVGNFLVLYGGYGLDGVKSDVWALDASKSDPMWVELEVIHGQPPPRSNHIAVPIQSGERPYLVVFGGSDAGGLDTDTTYHAVLDLDEMVVGWEQVPIGDIKPSIRHGHIAVYPTPRPSGQLTVFGGLNNTADTLPTSFLTDSYIFDLQASAWQSVPQDEVAITARAYSVVANSQDISVVFGGFSGYTGDVDDRLLNDVWLYRHY